MSLCVTVINRSVVILRPGPSFIEWASKLDDSGIVPSFEGEQTVYLVPEFEDDEAANLCHEAGAYCEANRRNLRVTASVCVSRSTPEDSFVILSPCGICQERLAAWGLDVEVAIPQRGDPTKWESKSLREVQPYYWGNVKNEPDY